MALAAERRVYLDAHAISSSHGAAAGGRLGRAQTRELVTTAGTVEVSAPRVDDRREGERFTSAILLPYLRRSARVIDVLPLLYPRRLSTKNFAPALQGYFGSDAGAARGLHDRDHVNLRAVRLPAPTPSRPTRCGCW